MVRRGLAGIVLTTVFVGLLLWFSDLSRISDVLHPRPHYAVGFLVITGAMLLLTSEKWRMLVIDLAHAQRLPSGYYPFYASLGLALGSVMPQDLSSVVVRTHALRTQHGVPLGRGAYTVLLDRLTDYLVLGAVLVPSVLYLSGVVSMPLGLALAGLALAALASAWYRAPTALLELVLRLYNRALSLLRRVPVVGLPRPGEWEPVERELTASTANRLLAFSILRFFMVVTRGFLLALALDVDIPWTIIFLAAPVAQLGMAVPLTPGGLGVVEIGWLGVLTLAGTDTAEATVFLAGLRMYSVLALIVLVAMAYGYYRHSKRLAPEPTRDTSPASEPMAD